MNEIRKKSVSSIGYNFVTETYLPEGKDEYHLRNLQNRNGINYRNLSAYEIEVLVRNNNTSDNWNYLQVSDAFNPELVKNCKFFGLVRIGKLEPVSLEYHNVAMPVGLYNSTIISCDFGDNVIINNVNYMSHYIIGNEVMIVNVHELHTTNHSKFGNGIIKDGESDEVRIWLEVCNENGGRKILPFNGMLPGDAHLWAKYRDDKELMNCFKELTERKFDTQRGYYGKVGDRTVIKNTSIIKDVWVGSEAYIKGANKLKNLTINSREDEETQIGEGCELVNGIINYGCRIFYGAKAVRFIMASHSQLKYGARLINSYLGENSTISCCEVLNSLIFPAHEQHHNNSFLCAALIMGQSNIAAGATIGSNHNSRAADGEMAAGRGFWPGLCVSLKHNSKFATFTLIAKGDYPNELNIPLPFSLINNDVSNNRLIVMPAYWFLYNMYALARNSSKYSDRDKRSEKVQHLEYDFLAPDSVNEIFNALHLIRLFVGRATGNEELKATEMDYVIENLDVKVEVLAEAFECSNRPVQLVKVKEAYSIYKRLIVYYGIQQILDFIGSHSIDTFNELMEALPVDPVRLEWMNIGGQLLPSTSVTTLLQSVKNRNIETWDQVHQFYEQNGKLYSDQKLQHAYASLLQILDIKELTPELFKVLLLQLVETREWMYANIYSSREKDYQSEFRKMMYNNDKEMEAVVGRLVDNVFIQDQKRELEEIKERVNGIITTYNL
jgi:hypothetical protein